MWISERRSRQMAVLLAAVTMTLTGGCTVSTENNGPSPSGQAASAQEALLERGLEIDLSKDPTRADFALPEEGKRVILEREDQKPFDVTVRFRDGHVLTTTAVVLIVRTKGPGLAPDHLVVRRDGLTQDELVATLEAAVDEVGADAAATSAYVAKVPTAGEGTSDLIGAIRTSVARPDELTLEPVVSQLEGRASINYVIEWGLE